MNTSESELTAIRARWEIAVLRGQSGLSGHDLGYLLTWGCPLTGLGSLDGALEESRSILAALSMSQRAIRNAAGPDELQEEFNSSVRKISRLGWKADGWENPQGTADARVAPGDLTAATIAWCAANTAREWADEISRRMGTSPVQTRMSPELLMIWQDLIPSSVSPSLTASLLDTLTGNGVTGADLRHLLCQTDVPDVLLREPRSLQQWHLQSLARQLLKRGQPEFLPLQCPQLPPGHPRVPQARRLAADLASLTADDHAGAWRGLRNLSQLQVTSLRWEDPPMQVSGESIQRHQLFREITGNLRLPTPTDPTANTPGTQITQLFILGVLPTSAVWSMPGRERVKLTPLAEVIAALLESPAARFANLGSVRQLARLQRRWTQLLSTGDD